MADDDITLASTSDSLEEVQAALGYPADAAPAPADAAAAPAEAPVPDEPVAEPPVEGDEALPEDEAPAEDAADQSAAPKPPRRNRLQERLNELSREAYAAKGREAAKDAENVALRARLAELAAGRAPAVPVTEPPVPASEVVAPEPNPDDFPTYDGYTKAMAQWAAKSVAEQVVTEHAKKAQADDAAARRAEAMQVVNQRYSEQLNVVRDKYEDFAEVTANDDVRVTQIFADGMKLSPVGAEMLYHLAKNPEYAAQVHKLGNGPLAAREFGKLEARLEIALGLDGKAGDDGGSAASGAPTGPRSVAAPSPARKATAPHAAPAPSPARPRVVTRAPDPIRPIDGGNVVSTKPPDQMSFQEYKAYRNRQQREAAGR